MAVTLQDQEELGNVGDGVRVTSELNRSEPFLKIIVIKLKYKTGMDHQKPLRGLSL